MLLVLLVLLQSVSTLPKPDKSHSLSSTFQSSRESATQQNCKLPLSLPKQSKLGKTTAMTVKFFWPMVGIPYQNAFITNYVDQNRPGAGMTDYAGFAWTYDNHLGTDIAPPSFRQTDHGVPVLAAADGLVFYVSDGYPDRNIELDYAKINQVNLVGIQHADGSVAWYAHFRKNSIRVRVGESVTTGSILGLTGSSGYSSGAHLHFEPQYPENTPVDPFHTTPANGFWQNTIQPEYAGTPNRFRLMDAGIANKSSYKSPVKFANGGSDIWLPMKERLTQPEILADSWNGSVIGPDTVIIWWQYQGTATVNYRITIEYDWSGNNSWTLWNFGDFQTSNYNQGGWSWLWLGIPSGPAKWRLSWIDLGTMETRKTVLFDVGSQTTFKPRLLPAGKSFETGTTIQDTLKLVNYTYQTPLSFSFLPDAPSGVTINSSTGIVTIPNTLIPDYRSVDFRAVVTDAAGKKDTMYYNLIRSLEQDQTLPVSLEWFNVKWNEDYQVEFSWQTASEINNIGFILQSKSGDNDWETVSDYHNPALAGLGNSSFGKSYSFNWQYNGLSDFLEFRLGTADYNGTIIWEKTAMAERPVHFNVGNPFPNPANPFFTLPVTLSSSGNISLSVFNLLGQQVYSKTVSGGKGINHYPVQIDNSVSGVYFVSVQTEKETVVRKILMIK